MRAEPKPGALATSAMASGPAGGRGKGPDGPSLHGAERRAAPTRGDEIDDLWTDLARVIASVRSRISRTGQDSWRLIRRVSCCSVDRCRDQTSSRAAPWL